MVERNKTLRSEGYMMDFFGSGWDVAERMGLADELRAIYYPIDALQFVDSDGKVYASVPIARIGHALGGKYVYVRRSDPSASSLSARKQRASPFGSVRW